MITSCLITLVLRFALLAIPAVGIFFTHSLVIKIVFAALWLICGLWFSKYEKGTSTVVGTMHVQLPFVIIYTFDLRNPWIVIPLSIYSGMALLTVWRHYKAQVIINESLRAE